MVGKIKHVRQKLHQEAVKLERPIGLLPPPASAASPTLPSEPQRDSHPPPHPLPLPLLKESKPPTSLPAPGSFSSGIFSGTRISREALVQTLQLGDPADNAAPDSKEKNRPEKNVKSKKEKMKERRERWLNKISAIKQAKERQAATAQRQATPVVGDMRPLADALPELSELLGPAAAAAPTARRKSRKSKLPVKRPETTDFSQMKQSQKRKILESESGRFSDAAKTLAATSNPLADVGELLRKRMRQEEEQGPS